MVGFEGWYEVSDQGRVRRARAAGGTWIGRVLTTARTQKGYLEVALYVAGAPRRRLRVHLAVALAFLGAAPPGHEVDHIDRDRANPRLSNLRYLTLQQNRARSVCSKCGVGGHNRLTCGTHREGAQSQRARDARLSSSTPGVAS